MAQTPKPVRRWLKQHAARKRRQLPTPRQRGDGKNPRQLLCKYWRDMKSVKEIYARIRR